MKKNKKTLTKLALALGTVATVAGPIGAVISCGTNTNSMNVDDKVVYWFNDADKSHLWTEGASPLKDLTKEAFDARIQLLVDKKIMSHKVSLDLKAGSSLGHGAELMHDTWGYNSAKSPDVWPGGGNADSANFVSTSGTALFHQFEKPEFSQWANDLQLDNSGNEADWDKSKKGVGKEIQLSADGTKKSNVDLTSTDVRLSFGWKSNAIVDWHWSNDITTTGQLTTKFNADGTAAEYFDDPGYKADWNMKAATGQRKISNSNFSGTATIEDPVLGRDYPKSELFKTDDIDTGKTLFAMNSGWNEIRAMMPFMSYLRGTTASLDDDGMGANVSGTDGKSNSVTDYAFIPKTSSKDPAILKANGIGSMMIKPKDGAEYGIFKEGNDSSKIESSDYQTAINQLVLGSIGSTNYPLQNINGIGYGDVAKRFRFPGENGRASDSTDYLTAQGFILGNTDVNKLGFSDQNDLTSNHKYDDLLFTGSEWAAKFFGGFTANMPEGFDSDEILKHIHAYTTPQVWLMDNGKNEDGSKTLDIGTLGGNQVKPNKVTKLDGHDIAGLKDGKATLEHTFATKSSTFAGTSTFINKRAWEIKDPAKRKDKILAIKVLNQILRDNILGKTNAPDPDLPEVTAQDGEIFKKLTDIEKKWGVQYMKVGGIMPGTTGFQKQVMGSLDAKSSQTDRILVEAVAAASNSFVPGADMDGDSKTLDISKLYADPTYNPYGDTPDNTATLLQGGLTDPADLKARLSKYILHGANSDFSQFGKIWWADGMVNYGDANNSQIYTAKGLADAQLKTLLDTLTGIHKWDTDTIGTPTRHN